MNSTSTYRWVGIAKVETIAFADRTRRYRITVPCAPVQGIQVNSLVACNKITALRPEALIAFMLDPNGYNLANGTSL